MYMNGLTLFIFPEKLPHYKKLVQYKRFSLGENKLIIQSSWILLQKDVFSFECSEKTRHTFELRT